MELRRIAAERPLIAALVAEALLIPLALGLALLLGEAPWTEFHWSPGTLVLAIAATVPLIAGLTLFGTYGPAWFRELESLVRPAVEMLFRGRGRGVVILAALLAGFGEELLFRGVLQAWLTEPVGAWPALVAAAVVFGLMHAVSRAYFVVATVMGLYLGALYLFSGSLLLVCLVHALYDWFAIEYVLRAPTENGEQAR